MVKRQPWIYSAGFDSVLILGPAFFSTAVVLIFRNRLDAQTAITPLLWLLLVVGIDVAHVYSTLFRTFWEAREDANRRSLFFLVVFLCWLGGALLYSIQPMLFWTVLAYVAVYHFVRQQYGFAMIYSRGSSPRFRWLDKAVIYAATLYPLVYWHAHLPRNFNWFIEGDFLALSWFSSDSAAAKILTTTLGGLYVLLLIGYVVKEIYLARTEGPNVPRNLLIIGTAASWYVGIVLLNGDLAFTLTNVVSHGIPYMALIWVYGRRRSAHEASAKSLMGRLFRVRYIPIYLAVLISLAYLEEGFWDGFVWRDHAALFPAFSLLPHVGEKTLLAVLIPLLALPQSAHYVLDGLLWRVRGASSDWKSVLLSEKGTT